MTIFQDSKRKNEFPCVKKITWGKLCIDLHWQVNVLPAVLNGVMRKLGLLVARYISYNKILPEKRRVNAIAFRVPEEPGLAHGVVAPTIKHDLIVELQPKLRSRQRWIMSSSTFSLNPNDFNCFRALEKMINGVSLPESRHDLFYIRQHGSAK